MPLSAEIPAPVRTKRDVEVLRISIAFWTTETPFLSSVQKS